MSVQISEVCAQEGTDQLKLNADKAQEVFDKASAKPGSQVPKEELPQYPGGEPALYNYLKKGIKYPPQAQDQGITGKVYVGFIIEKTGRVDSVWVQRSAHALLDAEAMRVVDAMPDWSPGTQDGKPVRVQYVLPINFTMDPAQLEKIRKKAAKRKAREKS
ncbi:MAG: energy transducer TonB [Flavobacteriales bacterium]|nr:energy transducer TonB [Flavobacteriales bacterium]